MQLTSLKLIIEDEDYLARLAEAAYDEGRIEERTYLKVRRDYPSIEKKLKEVIVKELSSKPSIKNGFKSFDIDRREQISKMNSATFRASPFTHSES